MRRRAGHALILACLMTAWAATTQAQESPVRHGTQVLFTLQSSNLAAHVPVQSIWIPSDLVSEFGTPRAGSDDDSWFGNELVGQTMVEMDDLMHGVTMWTRRSETVQPILFVHNRLANIGSRRVLEHLEPKLREQNRVYCVGLRFTW